MMLSENEIKEEVKKLIETNGLEGLFNKIDISDVSQLDIKHFERINDQNAVYIDDYRYCHPKQLDENNNSLYFPLKNYNIVLSEKLKRNVVYKFASPENGFKYRMKYYDAHSLTPIEEIKKEYILTLEHNKIDLRLDFSNIPIGDEKRKLLIVINENPNHMYLKIGQKIDELRVFSYGPVTMLDQENARSIQYHNILDYIAIGNNDHRGLEIIND